MLHDRANARPLHVISTKYAESVKLDSGRSRSNRFSIRLSRALSLRSDLDVTKSMTLPPAFRGVRLDLFPRRIPDPRAERRRNLEIKRRQFDRRSGLNERREQAAVLALVDRRKFLEWNRRSTNRRTRE